MPNDNGSQLDAKYLASLQKDSDSVLSIKNPYLIS